MPAIADLSVADWHRLNRLLEAALLLDEDARSAWMRDLPASEADLAPLLKRLLSSRHLTETAQFAAAVPPASADERCAEERQGRLLGPYRLQRELGQGGMGTVWLAERADGAFERQVALKLPRAEWTDRGLAQRFARERALLASLNHPNIAQLFDAGWSESGRPYLALEYVEGQPINSWCERRRLNIAARLVLFVEVIRAVAHAHARLIVHRDLKPSNVLVTAEGKVKLLDFGIAKLLVSETAAAQETELTRMAGRALTLNYAAPEQILGQPVSTAADVYSLGVLLFELLTGDRPYRLSRDVVHRRSSLEEAIVRIDAPAPSSTARDRATRRALRGDLDAIVLKALNKSPEQRYETAAAFADDIERHLARLPVRAQRAGRLYRVSRFLVRNRLTVGAVGAVIVALTAGLSVALWQATVARGEAARANVIKDFVLSIIQQADPVASRQTREADIALLTTAEARVDQELAGNPELALQMRRAIGAAYRNRGEYKRTHEVLSKGIEQARAVLPRAHLDLLGAMVQVADEWVIDSRKESDDLEAAIGTLKTMGSEGRALLADALMARHRIQRWRSPWKVVRESAREAWRLAHGLKDEGRMLVAAIDLTEWYFSNGVDPNEALQVIAQAHDEAVDGGRIEASDPRRITAMGWLGVAQCAAGQKSDGLGLTQQALEAARRYHASNTNLIEVAQANVGFAFACTGDSRAALEAARQAYAMAVKRDPPDSENRQFRKAVLLNALRELDLHEEMEQVVRETPFKKPKPGSAPIATRVQSNLWEANIRSFLGHTEIAEHLAEEALLLMETDGMQAAAVRIHLTLAEALHQNGKFERAEASILNALQEGSVRPEDQDIPWSPGRRVSALMFLSQVRIDGGRYQSGLDAVEQAYALLSAQGMPSASDMARVNWRRGRSLLGLGRHGEAVDALSRSHAYWQQTNADSLLAAYVSHWYGRALLAAGETTRGRALMAAARPKLAASRLPRERALAEVPGN